MEATLLPLLLIITMLNTLLIVGLVLMIRRAKNSDGTAATFTREMRQEIQQQLGQVSQELQRQRSELGEQLRSSSSAQNAELSREREARQTASKELTETLHRTLNELRNSLEQRFDVLRQENEGKLEQMRQAVDEKLQGTLKNSLAETAKQMQALTDTNQAKQLELQRTLSAELEKLRSGNEAKLEQMRATVDGKLQDTLEKRIGKSFALVSERLEMVQKGLGEMQSLAQDVGGLKRVLTNVKSRGTWGEVQLARQLEDVLTSAQYAANVSTVPGSAATVEFAVRLPGQNGEAPVWLPIDSKFPQEDYERLLSAQDAGDPGEIKRAQGELQKALLTQAKTISSKYVKPPHTTDFAIMYLPTEGLFAEVLRIPGFMSRLQNEHRIAIVGPTTLMSLLNSLQMGFRTLAIQERSSEVWKVLSAAKSEFQKYGSVWDKLSKQLETAQKTVHEVATRSRAVERSLRSVENAEIASAADDPLGTALAATRSEAAAPLRDESIAEN